MQSMVQRWGKWLGIAFALLHAGCSSGDKGSGFDNTILIGSLLGDLPIDRPQYRAAQLAIEEINAAGVFQRKFRITNRYPATGDTIDIDKAREQARIYHDQDHALGLLISSSSIVQGVIDLSNKEAYQNLITCSGTATSPLLNDASFGGDGSDAFFRTIVTDLYYLDFGIQLMLEKNWKRVGLYRVDSAFGAGIGLVIQEGLNRPEVKQAGIELVLQELVPPGPFDIAQNQSILNSIIDLSQTEGLDVLLLFVEPGQDPSIVKYLTEGQSGKPLNASIWISAGSKGDEIFDIAKSISSWTTSTRTIFGVEADTLTGMNSRAFEDAYQTRFEEPPNYSCSTFYDCVFAFALSLLYESGEEPSGRLIKTGIQNFKLANRSEDEIQVGIGVGGLQQAAQAIGEGKRVNFQGASGELLFDDIGDRPKQGMRVFQADGASRTFVITKRYDENLQPLP